MASRLFELGPFARPGGWSDAVTNTGERYLPLVKPYGAAMHLGHMASYREALRYSYARRVLDLGCGTGYGAFFLASHGAARVTAVDMGAEPLDYAMAAYRHPRLVYARGDASRLPFANGSFDFVFSSQVIEHLPAPAAFLAEVRRVLSPAGFCLITTPNRSLFSPAGPSDNVHHLNEMDVQSYAEIARRVFPRVQIRGIAQRCLVLRPGESVPSTKSNAELRPEDYRVQSRDVDECENLLCFAHADADGCFQPSLPPHLTPVADELGPTFWDPAIASWVVMTTYPPDGPAAQIRLRFGQQIRASFRSPRAGLYRVEVDTAEPIGVPVHATLRDEAGALIARCAVSPEEDRVAITFARQAGSRDQSYSLGLGFAPRARALRFLVRPARLEARAVGGGLRLAIRTFHDDLPAPGVSGQGRPEAGSGD